MPAPTTAAPIREMRINQVIFAGESGAKTIQAAVNYAAADGGSFMVVIPPGYPGNESIASITGGGALIYLSDQRTATAQSYIWNGAAYAPADFTQLGRAAIVGSLSAGNFLVGTTATDYLLHLVAGQGQHNQALLETTDPDEYALLSFKTPARLWQTGVAGPGAPPTLADKWYVYDATTGKALITVAAVTGDTIIAGSLTCGDLTADTIIAGSLTCADLTADAATLAACEVDGSPVRTFENSPDGPGGMEWPPAGIGVSTGTAWAASIDPATLVTNPATVARTNTANTFTADQTFGGKISATAAVANLQLNPNGVGAVLLSWTGGTGGTHFGDGAGGDVGHVDSSGNAAFTGTLTAAKDVGFSGNGVIAGTLSAVNGNLRLTNSRALGTPFIYGDSTNLMLNSSDGGAIWIGLDSQGITHFGTGGASTIAANGDAHFAGDISAATKSFRIPHPLDATKNLVHSCLEGPEVAVFYRGEATVKTEAEVVLPDYFEALTRPEGRSVQLTQIFEDDGEVMIGSNVFTMLQASRVKDGKFRIRSNSTQSVKVYWEVKAVRSDVPALVVEAEKEDQKEG